MSFACIFLNVCQVNELAKTEMRILGEMVNLKKANQNIRKPIEFG